VEKKAKPKDLDSILDAEAAALLRTAIERAKSGDASALRLALERIQAPLKERSIKIDMPPIEGVNDLPRAIAFVVSAVSKGALTPSEGTAMTGMLGAIRSAFELVDMNAVLRRSNERCQALTLAQERHLIMRLYNEHS
jgi:hypothetical protein